MFMWTDEDTRREPDRIDWRWALAVFVGSMAVVAVAAWLG